MKKALGIFLIFWVFFGCASSKREQPDSDTSSGSIDQDMAIRQAVLDAFKLENELAHGGIQNREAVLSLFRRGFLPELAEKLTEYYWLEDAEGGMIRATEPLFSPPEKIDILKRQNDKAVVEIRKEGNAIGPNVWPAHILEVMMKKENAVWKILSIQPKSAEQVPDGQVH